MVSLKPHELMYISCMYKKIYIAWAIFEILYFVVMNVILFDGTTERAQVGLIFPLLILKIILLAPIVNRCKCACPQHN